MELPKSRARPTSEISATLRAPSGTYNLASSNAAYNLLNVVRSAKHSFNLSRTRGEKSGYT